jgi:Fur family ferric uptake transcriptional regulator
MSAGQSLQEPERLLRRRGLRPTPQRIAVVAELVKVRDDVTAQRLHQRMRAEGATVGLATVYRTLAALREHGVVDTLTHSPGELCYRLCADEHHHHHLVCSSCHRVVELGDCDLEPRLERIAKKHGFVTTSHRLEVTGLCSACRGTTEAAGVGSPYGRSAVLRRR